MISQELNAYIKSQKIAGISEENIRQKLINIGWQKQDIDEAFTQRVYIGPEIYSDIQYSGILDIGKIEENTTIKKFVEHKTEEKSGKSKYGKYLWIGIFAVVTIIGGLLFFIYVGKQQTSSEVEKTVMTPTPTIGEDLKLQKITDKNNKYQISVPQNWITDKQTAGDLGLKIISPEGIKVGDTQFVSSISVVSEDVPGMELAEYAQKNLTIMETSLNDFSLVKKSEVMVKNRPGIILETTYTQGILKIHDLQLLLMDKNTAYVITGSDLASNWIQTKDLLNQTLMSFEII